MPHAQPAGYDFWKSCAPDAAYNSPIELLGLCPVVVINCVAGGGALLRLFRTLIWKRSQVNFLPQSRLCPT